MALSPAASFHNGDTGRRPPRADGSTVADFVQCGRTPSPAGEARPEPVQHGVVQAVRTQPTGGAVATVAAVLVVQPGQDRGDDLGPREVRGEVVGHLPAGRGGPPPRGTAAPGARS